ncbi:hypothetical protein EXU57_04365 [Segetibacter sp. 3557_3]|uniref:SixA phosphatase family protein n=1 Tax=Segetibacter sp. 3557_3 TaxID=2547429 RepID=UPI001058E9FD|nr:phosphoglycerate mutase family protein [Segetibacter sp. 3557_3]TDH29304.1 hypothetical protein EXU57_04365 [Segetibacter sp. 3557_3]
MKKYPALLLLMFICGSFNNSYAQRTDSTVADSPTTIILVRHAEKDTVGGDDPELSAAGKKRSQQLQATLKQYLPDEFYSTAYKRTRQTLQPWAEKAGKEIKEYNPQNQEGFSQELLKLRGKTIVVAGHSNTVPTLVNLLEGAAKYQQLPDGVYNKIYIVTVRGKAVTDRVIEY